MAISGDTIVVGAPFEDSNAAGINGNQTDNSSSNSGTVYVFVRSVGTWTPQAYIKASNTGNGDFFGYSVSIDGDTTVATGFLEDSSATGVNGNQADNSAGNAGCAYVFVRNGTTWSQQAYLKASNTNAVDQFGTSASISGNTVVIGANSEDSAATGVNGNQSDNSASNSGAAYVFVRNSITIGIASMAIGNPCVITTAGNHGLATGGSTTISGVSGGNFGSAINATHTVTAISANQFSVPVTCTAPPAPNTGAATTPNWTQQAYLKASNTGASDFFANTVSISGNTIVVSAPAEDSNATGINGNQSDNSATDAGAAYVFVRSETTWMQQAYLKASNTAATDAFGAWLSVSGNAIVAGASGEDSSATGIDGNQSDNNASNSGAGYVFMRTGTTWVQQAYLKASNTGTDDGAFAGVSLSGSTIIAGARFEDSNATGVNGDQSNNSLADAGAAYIFELHPCIAPPPGMVLWLPLDESSATAAANLVPGANNGTAINGPLSVAGTVSKARAFDGVNDYVEVPNYPAINFGAAAEALSSFSVDAWIMSDADISGVEVLIDKRDQNVNAGYHMYIFQNGLGFQIASTNVAGNYNLPGSIPLGVWTHVAVTVQRNDAQGVRFYINGVEQVGSGFPATTVQYTGSMANTYPLRIGTRSSSLSGYLHGKVDELEVFNRVLTPAEITALYEAGSMGKCKNVFRGFPHITLGQATLAIDEATGYLNVGNLGASGLDGVSIALGDAAGWSGAVELPGDIRTTGVVVQSSMIGRGNGVENQVIGLAKVEGTGTAALLRTDFSNIGSTTSAVTLFDANGSQVGAFTIANNAALTINDKGGGGGLDPWGPPVKKFFRWLCEPAKDIACYEFGNSCVTDPLGNSYLGVTVIYVEANNITIPRDGVSAISLTGANISGVILKDESVQVAAQAPFVGGLGIASLTPSASIAQLGVSNLGSSGQDGVSIALGKSADTQVTLGDLRQSPPSGLWDGGMGSWLQSDVYGSFNGVAESALGNVRFTLVDTVSPQPYSITADFTAINSPTQRLVVMNGASVVATFPQHSGEVGRGSNPPIGIGKTFGQTKCIVSRYPPNTSFLIDGQVLIGDQLLILAESLSGHVDFHSEIKLRTSDLPEFVITGITAKPLVSFSGRDHIALGSATMTQVGSDLTIGNLGSSGQDGVEVVLTNASSVRVGIAPLNDAAIPVSATIDVAARGSINNVPDQPLGSLHLVKVASSNFQMTPDFSSINSPTHRVMILNNGALVANLPGHVGPVTVSKSPIDLGKLGGDIECYVVRNPDNTMYDIGGVLHFGNEIRLLAEGAAVVLGEKSAFDIRMAMIPSFTIIKESIGLLVRAGTTVTLTGSEEFDSITIEGDGNLVLAGNPGPAPSDPNGGTAIPNALPGANEANDAINLFALNTDGEFTPTITFSESSAERVRAISQNGAVALVKQPAKNRISALVVANLAQTPEFTTEVPATISIGGFSFTALIGGDPSQRTALFDLTSPVPFRGGTRLAKVGSVRFSWDAKRFSARVLIHDATAAGVGSIFDQAAMFEAAAFDPIRGGVRHFNGLPVEMRLTLGSATASCLVPSKGQFRTAMRRVGSAANGDARLVPATEFAGVGSCGDSARAGDRAQR